MNSIRCFGLTYHPKLLMAAAIGTATVGYDTACADKPKSKSTGKKGRLTFQETVDYMKPKLNPIRESLQKEGYYAPYLEVKDITSGKDTQAVRISIALSSLYGLGQWMSLLSAPMFLVSDHEASGSPTREIDRLEFDDSSKTNVYMESFPNPRLSIRRNNGFTAKELDTVLESYEKICKSSQKSSNSVANQMKVLPFSEMLNGSQFDSGPLQFENRSDKGAPDSPDKICEELEKLGVTVFQPGANTELSWSRLAGYESVKKEITDTVLNYLKYPDIYNNIVMGTREHYEPNRPRAILLEGPPGTGAFVLLENLGAKNISPPFNHSGKTMSARIIAGSCNRHMIHIPLETIVNKWYGESEKSLSKV